MNRKLLFLALPVLLWSCGKEVKVTVRNDSGTERAQATVELQADSVLSRLGSQYCYVVNAGGEEIPSQVTYDGKLIFQSTLAPGASAQYKVLPSDTARVYPRLTSGRFVPQRSDDLAWENEVNGYRAYGPATQARGERGFGYDLFFKHKTDEQVLERIYAPEIDPRRREKLDSVKKNHPDVFPEYERSVSYHLDHGLGMDCFAVGPTLGAGVAAVIAGDSICYPWCYEKGEVLDNGPLRFTARLDYAPVAKGGDSAVAEHRLISLDAGSYLNATKVWYDGLSGETVVAAGFPVREGRPYMADNMIVCTDPTQGADNGHALLGITSAKPFFRTDSLDGHALGFLKIQPTDTVSYSWGFAWDRGDIRDTAAWISALRDALAAPLSVEY